VKAALEGLKGIKKADVSFTEQKATVIYDPQTVDVKDMIEAVERSAFSARTTAQK
jgi:copper chaperone CopZ